ncbi:MAG: DNA polymerase I [Verrucomicrobia bacterium]|nr:DNA polymerase I [Verrucomicrobiota bacterium]
MKNLYIIDAVNFLFRSYYAIKGMTNAKGESTNALFGLIRSIYKIIDDFSPDYVVAVFDGPDNKQSRTKIYAEYKSHRTRMPEDLVPQLEHALSWCAMAGIPHLSVPGVEADDTMGSIARWAEKQGIRVYLCSSDKDLCQLVDDHIFLLHAHKDNMLVDRKKVEELYGIKPEQMIDYLAIVGDASDNIPGLEGFGPKTASELLQKFGSLDALLQNPELVTGAKKQEMLKTGKDVALMSRELATIHLGVDFPKEETFFHLKAPDMEKVKAFYDEMRFMSLLKEMDITKTVSHKSEDVPLEYTLVEDINALVAELEQETDICIDTETTSLHPLQAQLVGIGFSTKPGKAWYVPWKKELFPYIEKILSHPSHSFYGHNIKYDLHVLVNAGFLLPRISFDTILASYLLNPHSSRHGLDHLALTYFHKVKISIEELIGKGKNQISMADVPLEKITTYCCEDVDYTVRLKNLFAPLIKEENLSAVLKDIELPLIPVLLAMERRGIYVDPVQLKKLSEDLSQKIGVLTEEIYKIAGEEFNLNSPKQLSKILFEKLGIKPPKKTATGFSTSADVLEELREESPIVHKILDYRTLEKLRSTYVDSLPENIHPVTKRIHCTFNQSVAATGRLSCQDPNLQNIPVRTVEGKKIRDAFHPQEKGWSFIGADYSQIELRILAHLSEDPVLIQAFQDGEDIHAYTASLVFDVPLPDVTDEMRRKAKAVNFGILYGQQAFGLSQGLDMNYKEAAAFIETYFKRYPRVKEYIEFCKESARKTKKSITMTGRLRPIPEIDSKNPILRAAAERLAINTPLQGTAADLIKMAMIQIDAFLRSNPGVGYMLLQIHDELIFEVPDHEIERVSSKVKNIMENVVSLKVPLEVHISIGKNWGEC